ncbi:hypothetical protein H0H92_011418 [Tricholoma furcatifolium]|nr:hypothetical protein H0H92_011418 [Tricholoma furcatifolium]
MRSSLFLSVLCLAIPGALARVYNIFNNCPQNINIFINGRSQGKLGVRTTLTRTLAEDWSGSIYTDANGGSADGSGGMKAGFYGKDNYYYIVDEARLNTGVSIVPMAPAHDGFCERSMCENKACNAVYYPDPKSFPPPSNVSPTPPLYECPGNNVGYNVTFCVSGVFPPPRNSPPVNIHPNGDKSKCLDVRGDVVANGTAIQIYDCNGTDAQKWLISADYTLISLFASTSFNVDAGSANPTSGTKVTLWQYSDVEQPSQAWAYTEDKRIQLYGTGQCLDLTGGSKKNGNPIQTWDCTAGSTNQIWTFP